MDTDLKNESLRILLFSFDWRNLYETNIGEIFEKLERDGLAPSRNSIFSIHWSTKGYYKKINNNLATLHLKAHLGKIRFVYDLVNIFLTPFLLKKYRFSPDMVVIYDFPSVFLGLGAKFFWGSRIVLIVTNIPTQLIRTRPRWGFSLLYQKVSEFFAKYFIDYAITISTSTEKYMKALGVSPKKIRVFSPNVIARDEQFFETARTGWVRERLNISKEKKIILSVGRLEPEKNFTRLIEIFKTLNRKDLVLIIVGQGSEYERLNNLVAKHHLQENIIFAGFVERKDIWNFYRDADVFILLSKSEGLGLVFWEAMYARVPVIGSMADGIVETIGENGLRGFLITDDENTDTVNAKIDACIAHGDRVTAMIERARAYVSEKISRRATINDILGDTEKNKI